jgi:hypothetical protein
MHTDTSVAMIQRSLLTVQAASRPWHGPHVGSFLGMQNARVVGIMEASTQISKEDLGGQAVCSRVGFCRRP